MSKTLFIIGNGFDRHHGLKTSYHDYRGFILKRFGPNTHALHGSEPKLDFEEFPYFTDAPTQDRWTDVETTLEIDYAPLVRDALESHYPRMSDDNPGWNDALIDIENQAKFIYDFTGEWFLDWLMSIDTATAKPDIEFPSNALFVTFNYTNTLEVVYGIDSCAILHVHGAIRDYTPEAWLSGDVITPSCPSPIDGLEASTVVIERAVFNHDMAAPHIQFGNPNNNPKAARDDLERAYGDDDFYGATIEPCVNLAVEYAGAAFKDLAGNYEKLSDFLTSGDIGKVVVFGHSYDGIDLPYYENVFAPRFRGLPWLFVLHGDDAVAKCEVFCQSMGITDYSTVKSSKGLSFA